MRYLLLFAFLWAWGTGSGQASGFTFSYTGPSQILVGPNCEAPLDWGHPNTPTVSSNIPGGVIVSFTIFSISGGYQINDLIPGGTTVTVFYQALDNFGNTALFGFTVSFVDVLPPVFDPFTLPTNITISCLTNLPPPAMVEATDNCNNDNTLLTITYTQTTNAQMCTGGTITRTWVADDGLGNQSTFNQTITVTPDNTPPVISGNLQNGMAPCSTAMAQYSTWLTAQRAAFTATDAGCGLMSLSDNAPSPAIITSFCGVIDVTFSATDNCNNTSTVIRTFTVFNNVAPVITTPATDASGNCSQANIAQTFASWISSHGGAEATDDCSSIFWTTSPASPSINDTCDAAIQVLFIAGDGCNNFDTTAASFFLTDDTGPAFTADPSTIILGCTAAGIDSTLLDWLVTGGQSTAHDLCTSAEDLTLEYRIAGMTLTLEQVLQAWQDSLLTPCRDNVLIGGIGINNVLAVLPVQFTYVDNCSNETGKTGYFGVTDGGRPVFVTLPMDTSFACAAGMDWEDVFLEWYNTAGNASYMDACGTPLVNASMTADSAIQYLTAALDTACLQGVSVTIQFGLVDGCGNTSLTNPSASFGLQDTVPPTLVTPTMDFIAACSENVQAQLESWLDTLGGAQATDGCGALVWEFSWIDTSGIEHTGMPASGPYPELTSLDCSSGIEVIFTAYDICQNSVSDTALFSMVDTIPPVILIEQDSVHLMCMDSIPSSIPEVSDGCDENPVLTFTDSISMESCLGVPEYVIRTWTAVDACGNSSSAQQWFFRIDTLPPVFELPSDTVTFCSIDTLFLINVQDNCDPDPVITWEDQISGLACQQTLLRVWTVTDACGNFSTAEQQFDLSDTSPPVINQSPGHFIFTCSGSAGALQEAYEQWLDSVVVTDGCSDSDYFIAVRGSYIAEDTTTWPGTPLPDSILLSCGVDMDVEADLVAYDACGNFVVEEISFSVLDTVGPVFTNCVAVIIVEPDTSTCTGEVTLIRPDHEEICFPDDVRLFLQINNGDTLVMDTIMSIDTILPLGFHTALWIALDCHGNAGTCLTQIEIIDEDAIFLTCPADELYFLPADQCDTNVWIYPPLTSFGKCSGGLVYLRFEIEEGAMPDSVTFDSPEDSILVNLRAGIHPVFLIARDSTGDIDTCRYVIELRDAFPPEVLCQPGNVELHPSGLENIDLATLDLIASAEDACGIGQIVYDPAVVNCSQAGLSVLVTLTVFDTQGNSSTCTSEVAVQTQRLFPLWESQLCDDTLRLFANIPDGPETNYTYQWTGPNGFTSMDANPVIPDSDTTYSGIYFVTVESENGCISMGSAEILIQDLVSPIVLLSDDTICTNQDITFTTQTYSGDVIYQWYHVVVGGDTLLGNTLEPLLIYTPLDTGFYEVYAIVTQDTCASEPGMPVSFYVVAAPLADILETMLILCVDDTLFLSPASVIDSLQYHWTGPNGYSSDLPHPPGIPADDIDSSAVYYLKVSNAFCTSTADSIEVRIQLPPATPEITGDALACEGGVIQLYTLSSHETYTWIGPDSTIIQTDEDTLILSPAMMSQSGSWRVIVFENGCPSDTSAAFNVQIDSAIQITIVAPHQFCEGDSIHLLTDPSGAGQYQWSGPSGFMSDEVSPVTLAESGTYAVSVQTFTGCEAEAFLEVVVDVLPVITSLVTNAEGCADGNTIFTIWAETEPPFSSGFEYVWEGPPSFVVEDSLIVLDSTTSAINGFYTLVIVNGACVSDTVTIEIDVTDSPAPPVITGETLYCDGHNIVLGIDSPLPGATYTWSSPDTNVVINSPGTLIIPNATQAWAGVFTVFVTLDGCASASSQITIQVKEALFAPSILSSPLACEGDSLILITNGPPGASYLWISSTGFESMEERPVIFPVQPEDEGTYQVRYVFEGCPSPVSNPLDIFVQPSVPPPTLEADIQVLCVDDPIPVMICIQPSSITAGAMYTFILNGTTIIGNPTLDSCITINGPPLQGGINNITAISAVQGCPSDTSIAISITGDQIPFQNADAGFDREYCPGEPILLQGSNPTPGSGVWTAEDDIVIFEDENDPGTEVLGLPSGTYLLTWTLSYASCLDYSSDEVFISVLSPPLTFPDTVEVPFGQTKEFVVTLNDSLYQSAFTLSIITNPQRGNALHAGNGIFRYTPNVGFVGTDMLVYRICSTVCPDECSESVVILRVGNEDDCFIPTLFTPNQDGINDRLIIPCLETSRYPNNKIIVFNEWGDAVFTASPYLNDWEGTIKGNSLPVGTYFYIMDFGDGSTPKRSFLILER